MPIDIYLAPPSPPCRAVLMTAKYLNIDIKEKMVDIMAGDQMKPEFIKMNPQHTIPTMDDNGFYLWESRAIQTYLVNKYAPDSPLYPVDPKSRAIIDRLLYFDAGTLYKAEFDFVYPQLFKGKEPDAEKEENFKKALTYLDGFLESTPYVAGDRITIADLSILASLTFAEVLDFSYDAFPKVAAWMHKMKSELSFYKEINEEPLNQLKEVLKSRK